MARGHIEHRGQDRWRILIDVGYDEWGKRKRLSHSVAGSRKKAEAELVRLLHEMATDTYVPDSGISSKDYLEKWLEHARTTTAPSTFRRYRQIVTKELIPAFGTTKLADLSPLQIQAFLGRSLTRKAETRDEALSPRTVLHFYRVLRRALGQAVRWQLLMRNPCDLVDPPRVQQTEMKALDEKQLLTLLAAFRGTRFYVPVLLAATTGMRRGEILGQRWSDVNLETGEMQVVRSLQETPEGLSFKTPKTRKGRRMVLLPQVAIAALKAHRAQQNEERLALGSAYQDQDLIFARADGSMWPPAQFSPDFRRTLRRRGQPAIRFHDLRHTHASQLLKAGVPVKVVSERLGHATASITLDVYSHVLPGMQAEAVAKIDAALGAAISG